MIYLGSDHAGFDLKEQAKQYFTEKGVAFEDCGASSYNEGDDYPDFGFPVAQAVGQGKGEGMLFCESAGGMTILANKVKGAYAVECATPQEAKHAKEHNNANVLVISHLAVTEENTLDSIVDMWLHAEWKNEERHARRVEKIKQYEAEHIK